MVTSILQDQQYIFGVKFSMYSISKTFCFAQSATSEICSKTSQFSTICARKRMEQFSETQCTCLLACNTHLLTVEILSERIISLSSITTCTHRLQGVLIVGILHVLKYLLFIIIIRKQKGVI